MRFLVLSGLSGAGKTTARNALEDLGYFMVDNLPPMLWQALYQGLEARGVARAGVVVDLRARAFLDGLEEALSALNPTVVFLEARPEVLLRRFNLTRRLHPLGAGNLMREIGEERKALSPLRARADLILDTSDLSPRELTEALARFLGEERGFLLRLLSFGFKWGVPQEADLVLDVRPFPNPHYDPHLRPKTGLDPEVKAYVFQEAFEPYYRALLTTLGLAAEGARREGRRAYTAAVGCTGGKHRSVALAERLAEELSGRFAVEVVHRDVEKE
ncbi:putative P-loop-containing kinase [Thermus oshimai JL-2]|uniref:Putative P-loop-containing kinase n=1 Tax=Thermus oshimai JL-2 TaxID=751945 RepID=K7R328_THEOS|nr:RNase adapter RapZ [Thermus oshimai]AFV75274.1 putative P-loop-containing kinase [Thermus oshimai JL-2]